MTLAKLIRDDDAQWPPTGGAPALLHVRDEHTSGTNGGQFDSGAWRTRVLNTVLVNEIGASLASNQLTLPAGTYWIEAEATAIWIGAHKAKLFNFTDTADILLGSSESNVNFTTRGSDVPSRIIGRFTLAAEKVLEIQHQCTVTAGGGFGQPGSPGELVEVYTDVRIWKKS